FSSRRRHTRFSRDWSSDVCSSDLCSYSLFVFAVGSTSPSTRSIYAIPRGRATEKSANLRDNFCCPPDCPPGIPGYKGSVRALPHLLLRTTVAASSLLCAAASHAIDPAYEERIVDAIYVIEGGPRAKDTYGILSVKVKDEAEARRVCFNTVRNNWRRWEAAGRPGEYIDFLADRY